MRILQLLFYLCLLPCNQLHFANCIINLHDDDGDDDEKSLISTYLQTSTD